MAQGAVTPSNGSIFSKSLPEIQKALITGYKDSVSLMNPKGATGADKIIAHASVVIKSTPALAKCSPASIITSILQLSRYDLAINSNNEAWLIPYGDTCTIQLGYAGLVALAYRSGMVKSIITRVVYDGDLFEYEMGSNEYIKHRGGENQGDQSKVTHAYCIITLASGVQVHEVMNKKQIDRVRAKGAANSPAWSKDYDEMARKTVLKRALKPIPKSAEMREAMDWDGAAAPVLDNYDRGTGTYLGKPEVVIGDDDLTPAEVTNTGGAE